MNVPNPTPEPIDIILNSPDNIDAMGRLMTLPNGGVIFGRMHEAPEVIL